MAWDKKLIKFSYSLLLQLLIKLCLFLKVLKYLQLINRWRTEITDRTNEGIQIKKGLFGKEEIYVKFEIKRLKWKGFGKHLRKIDQKCNLKDAKRNFEYCK